MLQLKDIDSFETIFTANYASLYERAWRFVQDRDIAEEIVQDVFYDLWKRRNEIVIHTSIGAYLHATTVNYALNYIKEDGPGQGLSINETIAAINSSEQPYIKGPASAANSALSKLPEACRTVFVLSRFENLSYRDIALQLNISVKSVESQISRALRILRSEIMAIAVCLLIFFISNVGINGFKLS